MNLYLYMLGLVSKQCKAKIIQRGAKKGERGFCPKDGERDPTDAEVAWPNATEVMYIILQKLKF